MKRKFSGRRGENMGAKKGGNWECHKSGLKDILLHILSGPLGRYSSFLFFFFFLFLLRSPPISFFSSTRVFKHHTFREPTLFLFLPPPILHTSTAFLYNLPSSVEANNNRVISHSSRLAHTKKKWKEIHSWMTLPERWGYYIDARTHTHTFIYACAHKKLSGSWLAFTAAGRPLYISTEYYVSKEERKEKIKWNEFDLLGKYIGRPFAV